MISFQGSVYVTFITHNKSLFLSKWLQWNNTNNFHFRVFHLNSYKRLTRHKNISFIPKWKWSILILRMFYFTFENWMAVLKLVLKERNFRYLLVIKTWLFFCFNILSYYIYRVSLDSISQVAYMISSFVWYQRVCYIVPEIIPWSCSWAYIGVGEMEMEKGKWRWW